MAELELDLAGPAAPPRKNGELVFEAPWESRLFGMTMAMCEAGVFQWEEFRRILIDEIGAWGQPGAPTEAWNYYACWGRAFERVLSLKGVFAGAELNDRARELAARPPGHDHEHGHLHDPEHGD